MFKIIFFLLQSERQLIAESNHTVKQVHDSSI